MTSKTAKAWTIHSVQELVEKVRKIAGIDFEVWQDPTRMRKVDRLSLAADIRRIQKLFGWEPLFSLDDTIREMWRDPDLPSSLIEEYRK